MSIIENQTNRIIKAEQRSVNLFDRLPASIVGKVAEFFPQTYGALPAVNREWKTGVYSIKACLFLRQDKENLDLIIIFQALGLHNHKIERYLIAHPITERALRNKHYVKRIATEIQTWIRANPDHSSGTYANHIKLNLSHQKLISLPLIAASNYKRIDLSHNRFTDLSFMKELPPNVQNVKFDSNPLKASIKTTLFLQKILLVLSTAAVILSIIPPIRFIGSLLLRSVSYISSIAVAKSSIENSDCLTTVLKCTKVVTATLGLAALILGQPQLLIIALGIDIALGLIDCIHGAIKENCGKTFMNLSLVILNALVAASLATGLWQILIAAAALSASMMLFTSVHSAFTGSFLECICHLILMGVGIASAITCAKMSYIDNYHYAYTNRTNDKVRLFDYNGRNNHEWFLNPGESIELDLKLGQIKVQHPFGDPKWLYPISSHETIIQEALQFNEFPTVPVGSPFVENTFIPFKPWARP